MSNKVPYYVREIRKGQDAAEQDNFLRAPRIMIAGLSCPGAVDRLSLGLLAAWRDKDLSVVGFSAGPSYQQLQALRLASGNNASTLDSWFHDEATLSYLLTHYTEGHRLGLITARTDYFDTNSPLTPAWSETEGEIPRGSLAELARLTRTPVVLVIDAAQFSFTHLAYMKGLLDFRDGEVIAGCVLAGLAADQLKGWKRQIEAELGIEVLGTLSPEVMRDDVPGLADYVPEVYEEVLKRQLERLAKDVRAHIEITRIQEIADLAPALDGDLPQGLFKAQRQLGFDKRRYRLGVALDEAFCYYFKENLDLLQEMGADPVYFSPLRDPVLPPDLDGLYFGTGKLLDYLAEASQNESLGMHIKRLSEKGLPIMAEGTGTVYLTRAFRTETGREWPLVGILPTTATLSGQARQKYYATMTARRDDLLAEHGTHIRCLLNNRFRFQPDGASYRTAVRGQGHVMEGFSTPTIWASQAKIHFYAEPLAPARFSQACLAYLSERTGNGEPLKGWN